MVKNMTLTIYMSIAFIFAANLIVILLIEDSNFLDCKLVVTDLFLACAFGFAWIVSVPFYIIFNIVLAITDIVEEAHK